jgi:hypothetical protein
MLRRQVVWLIFATLVALCAPVAAANYTDWTQPFDADANTRLLLHFDEALWSTTVVDSAPNPVDGTLNAGLAAQTDHHVASDKPGFGNALQITYTGAAKKVDFPVVTGAPKFWMGPSDFTMESWIHPHESNTYWMIFENYTGGDYNWGMLYDPPTAKMYMYFSWYGLGGWKDFTDWSTKWELETWNHAAVTVQRRSDTGGRDVVKFFKNGVQVFRKDVTGWGIFSDQVDGPASFGGRWIDGNRDYTVLGKIDEFRLSDVIRYGTQDIAIDGTVTLQGYTGDLALVPVTVELKQGATVLQTQTVTLSANPDVFSFASLQAGTYDVTISAPGFLRKVVTGITVAAGDTGSADAVMISGDIDGDNQVTSTDLSTTMKNINVTGD